MDNLKSVISVNGEHDHDIPTREPTVLKQMTT